MHGVWGGPLKTLSASKNIKISVEMSTEKPKLAVLAQKLDILTWEEVVDLAVQLGVDFSELQKIEREQNATLRALDIWLATDTEASWKKVVDALRAMKKNVLAEEIDREMRSPATAAASQQPIPSSQKQPAPLLFAPSSYLEGDMKPILPQSHSTPAGKLASLVLIVIKCERNSSRSYSTSSGSIHSVNIKQR